MQFKLTICSLVTILRLVAAQQYAVEPAPDRPSAGRYSISDDLTYNDDDVDGSALCASIETYRCVTSMWKLWDENDYEFNKKEEYGHLFVSSTFPWTDPVFFTEERNIPSRGTADNLESGRVNSKYRRKTIAAAH